MKMLRIGLSSLTIIAFTNIRLNAFSILAIEFTDWYTFVGIIEGFSVSGKTFTLIWLSADAIFAALRANRRTGVVQPLIAVIAITNVVAYATAMITVFAGWDTSTGNQRELLNGILLQVF